MCHKAKKKGLAIPYPTGPNSLLSGLRQSQQYFYDQYLNGTAATWPPVPGTSNHGWGDAVDVATIGRGVHHQSHRPRVRLVLGRSASQSGGTSRRSTGYGGSNPGPVDEDTSVVPLKQGDKGKDVHDLQARHQTARLPPAEGRVLQLQVRVADRADRDPVPDQQRARRRRGGGPQDLRRNQAPAKDRRPAQPHRRRGPPGRQPLSPPPRQGLQGAAPPARHDLRRAPTPTTGTCTTASSDTTPSTRSSTNMGSCTS